MSAENNKFYILQNIHIKKKTAFFHFLLYNPA